MFRPSMLACRLALALPLSTGLAFFSADTARGQEDQPAQLPRAVETQSPGTVETQAPRAVETIGLKEQLEKGLRARRPQEFEFIALVVAMVGDETLPLDLVKSTFLWARKKAITTRYPFPYFERALRERAGKLGIRIE